MNATFCMTHLHNCSQLKAYAENSTLIWLGLPRSMIINLLIREHPDLCFSVDAEPVYIVSDLYVHRISSGYEKLWQDLHLSKCIHVALKKTFEVTSYQVCLYDLAAQTVGQAIGRCDVLKITS